MDGNSLVCVSASRTGKTYSILPALCSRLILNLQNWLVPPGEGPVGIVICYSSEEVLRVGRICKKMLNPKEDGRMRVVMAFDLNRVHTFMGLLLNGCALLVATAPVYKAIYDLTDGEVFLRERVRVIAIDNFERIHVACSSELEALRTHWESPNLQMIVTSTTWHPQLATFLGRNKNTIICIGSYLEAALYGKVKFQVERQRDCAEKMRTLVQYLQKHDYRTQRTIVLTRNAVNLTSIVKGFQQHAIVFLVCSDSSSIDRNDGFRDWDNRTPGNIPVLICLDELLADLKVSKAQHIVHYSMPSTWKMFTKRFAVSFDFYQSTYLKPKEWPSSLVLLDEIDNDLLLKLVDLLQYYSLESANELSTLAQVLRSENAVKGSGSALCPQLLSLGACRIYRMCHNRHVAVEHDLQHTLPTRGVVLLRVIKMVSPVHFRCWITDSDSNGDFTKITVDSDIVQRTPAFGESMDLSIDVRIAGVVPSNNDEDWNKYSIQHAQQLVKDYSDKDNCYIYGNVLLTLHDMIWVDELFLVEDKKGEERSFVPTAFTASIISKNYGARNKKSFELIKQFIQHGKADGKQAYEPDSPNGTDADNPSEQRITELALSSESPSEPKTVSPDHSLVSMLPQVPDSVSSACSFEEMAPLPDHEQCSSDKLETGQCYQVGLGAYFGPNKFYIFILKNALKINKSIKEYLSNNPIKPLRDTKVGVFCLVRYGHGFKRGEIIEITSEKTRVFLLDYGNTISCQHESLFEMPTHLLRNFSFAAIEATFAYIIPPKGSSWTDDESRQIYRKVLDKGNSNPTRLDAHVRGIFPARREAGPAHHQYKVVLTSCDSNDLFEIVGELLDHDLVLFDHVAFRQDCTVGSDDEKDYVKRFGPISMDHAKKNPVATVKDLRPEKSDTSELQKTTAAKKEPSLTPSAVVKGGVLQQQRCYRYPMTQWFQDDHSVTLYVTAPDVTNLDFAVSTKKVQLKFVSNGDRYVLRLHLFGVIDAQNAKYEFRGLSIILRLPKLVGSNIHWPALLKHQTKICWLKKAAPHDDTESESASEPEEGWRNLPSVEQDDNSQDDYESECDEYT
ncbi:uncharacterized protein LOC131268900 [Anopheles coustani]|uniref:uncharacterized protein LOC131268900 n=1 Tax=Anopheles coustani TaxID=139045 RepID=UPI0026582427|nr:uncharacterized protein LOC131268900 [Anopheles coustani]